MSKHRNKRSKVSWSQDDDNLLLATVEKYRLQHDVTEDIDFDSIALAFDNRKTALACATRFFRLFSLLASGKYFATIEEVWSKADVNEKSKIDLSENDWNSCRQGVCREQAPDFERRHLPHDTRDHKEFVHTRMGAEHESSQINESESETTVNDSLFPFDIFGERRDAAQKAHLLPKARELAMTWEYPACAVLGLSIEKTIGSEVARKAVLGCTMKNPDIKCPSIRNMPCNIVRMLNQTTHFEHQPDVLIFPIYDVTEAKAWTGQGYEAIVVCASEGAAKSIGMTSVLLPNSDEASIDEINKAAGLASEVCRFLAHSVLKKEEADVNEYQSDETMKRVHKAFRSEKKIAVPFQLESSPLKPFFKISFVGHGEPRQHGHLAPDPLLLAFKSGNNWCRIYSEFRMVAVAEAEELDDDLSEEGG